MAPKQKMSSIITASELGQYTYCSCSWLLQRQGYTPDPYLLQKGTQAHQHLGKQVYFYQKKKRKSKYYLTISILLSLLALALLFAGWFLQ